MASTLEANLPTILLVDDDPLIAMGMRRILKKFANPHYVHTAADGLDAFQYLLRSTTLPVAVVLDLEMPRMSGIECLKQIRTVQRFTNLPVYILTSSTDPKDEKDANLLNVAGFFHKPEDLSQVAEIVRRIIDITPEDEAAAPKAAV